MIDRSVGRSIDAAVASRSVVPGLNELEDDEKRVVNRRVVNREQTDIRTDIRTYEGG